jgi:hypothetical protein
VGTSLIEKPSGSNSMETLLSPVSARTEIRFLTNEGDTRTLLRRNRDLDVGIDEDA